MCCLSSVPYVTLFVESTAACRYSPKQLYDVVSQVQHYKEFVPWCQRSHILRREGDTFLEAELEVGFKLFVER